MVKKPTYHHLEQKVKELTEAVAKKNRAEEDKQRTLDMMLAFMDNSPALIYIKDKEGKFINVNSLVEVQLKTTREDVKGKTSYDFFPKDLADKMFADDQKVLSGAMVEHEIIFHHEDHPHVLLDHKFPLIDKDGLPYAVCGIATDITHLKETESELRESEERYRTLTTHIADGVMLVQEQTILFANKALAGMVGHASPDDLEGKESHCFVDHEFKSALLQVCDTLISEPMKKNIFQASCTALQGKKFWMEGHFSVTRWKGRPAILATIRDITESKMREMTMEQETEALRQEATKLKATFKEIYRLGSIIGNSPAMQGVYDQTSKAASTDATVIIQGESGTGKELVARAIHELSKRSRRNFIPVNCSAIPGELVESEFFGHRKGAFTGAHRDREGFLRSADGGTLFLDEVGEIPLAMQAKLLRAVESGEYIMLGDTKPQKADVRIVAATGKDLSELVAKGLIRDDFYYRIKVVTISLPPLRERKEDIPVLAFHFLNQYGSGKKIDLPAYLMEALYSYDWPGNVREMQSAIQRYVTMGNLGIGTREGKPAEPDYHTGDQEASDGLQAALEHFEKGYIRQALNENQWKRGKAASALQISPRTLHRKMRKLGLM